MVDHMRKCPLCLVGLPCNHLTSLLANMTSAEIIEAATEAFLARRAYRTRRREAQRARRAQRRLARTQ